MSTVLILIFLAIQTAGGYLIGRKKGRPLLGTTLGFFLGLIGWLILAFVKPTYDVQLAREVQRLQLARNAQLKL